MFLYPFLLCALIGQVHAEEDEEGAYDEEDGDLFGENEPRKENGGHRIEIDIVCGHYSAQFLHCPVPGKEAEHGGHAS